MLWKNHFYHIWLPSLNVTIFITHVRNCVMGATPMSYQSESEDEKADDSCHK